VVVRTLSRLLMAALAATSCGGMAATQPGTVSIAAPVVTAPACGGVARWPTEPVTLSWAPLSGASTYTIELDCMNCGTRPDPWVSQSGTPWQVTPGLQSPTYRLDVAATVQREGGRAMRWRVWAVGREGVEGTKSDWCVTVFNDSGLPTPGARIP
jgi:hypothetical protein